MGMGERESGTEEGYKGPGKDASGIASVDIPLFV